METDSGKNNKNEGNNTNRNNTEERNASHDSRNDIGYLRTTNDEIENYFDIISFKDRIKTDFSIPDTIKNKLFQIIATYLIYFFGLYYSNYLSYLVTNRFSEGINFLTGYLLLSISSNIFGGISGAVGGILADLTFQTLTTSQIYMDKLLISLVIGITSGIFKFNREKTIPNLTVLKYFYMNLGSLVFLFLVSSAFSPDTTISFTISAFLSYVFLGPLSIVLINKILQKKANQFNVVYSLPLTHHDEFQSDHAIPIDIGGYNVFICTRCSATVGGIIIASFVETIIQYTEGISITPLTALLICIVFPAIGLLDWGTQTLGLRTSNDTIRTFTGILLGIAIHFVSLTDELINYLMIVLVIHFSVFTLFFYLGTKRMRKQKEF